MTAIALPALPAPPRGPRSRGESGWFLVGQLVLLALAATFPALGARSGVSSVLPPLRAGVTEVSGGAIQVQPSDVRDEPSVRSVAPMAVPVARTTTPVPGTTVPIDDRDRSPPLDDWRTAPSRAPPLVP